MGTYLGTRKSMRVEDAQRELCEIRRYRNLANSDAMRLVFNGLRDLWLLTLKTTRENDARYA